MSKVGHIKMNYLRFILTVMVTCQSALSGAQVRYKDQVFESVSITSKITYGQERTK